MTRPERDLVSRARAGMTPSRADRARMRGRLLATLGAAGAAGTAATATAAAAANGSSTALIAGASAKLLLVLVGTSVAGAVGYAALSPSLSSSPSLDGRPEVTTTAEPSGSAVALGPVEPPAREATEPAALAAEPAPAAPEPSLEVAAPAVAHDTSAERLRPTRTSEASPIPPPPAGVTVPDPLEAELSLIASARRAIAAEDPAGALRLLDEHARRFPDGALSEDRDAQRVRAFCAAGDLSSARREAARFAARYPESLHAAAMADPCAPAD